MGLTGRVEVVGPHDLARRVGRRGDEDRELTEAEQHERAEAPREVAHRVMRERAAGEVVG